MTEAAQDSNKDDMMAIIQKAKPVLESADSQEAILLETLLKLETLGALPTQILRETMIGKTVNTLAKSGKTESIRSKARSIVNSWRGEVQSKKRKSSGAGDDTPPLKKAASGNSLVSDSQESMPGKLERSDSLMSVQSEPAGEDEVKQRQRREKVKQKIFEALGKNEEIKDFSAEKDSKEEKQDFDKLAAQIEQAFFDKFQKETEKSIRDQDGKLVKERTWDEKAYMNQIRTVLYNLKDSKNFSFRYKVTVGYFKPEHIPSLKSEEMASDEKNAERKKMREDAMAEIDQGWALKNGAARISGMFTCGKCKGTKTTYFQMQTRSSDEPMTTFVTCLTCNNRWKFS